VKKKMLGNTGLEVTVAGFGVLPIGPSQLKLPVEEGAEIIRYALEKGINFLDTAQYYRTYPYIKKALEDGKYDDVIICSKSLCEDYDGMMDAIYEAREDLNREKIDIFLMHEVRAGGLKERQGAWQALENAKEKGLVRSIGLSTHHVDIAMDAADMKELDVVFPLINYKGLGIRKGDEFASKEEMMESIKACHAAGKGVFSKLVDDVCKAVVTAVGAVSTDPHPPRRQIHVIHQNQNFFRGNAVKIRRFANGLAGKIHIRQGLHQKHSVAAHHCHSRKRTETGAQNVCPKTAGKSVNGHITGIMPRLFVFPSGVTETCDDPFRCTRGFFFFPDLLEKLKNIRHMILRFLFSRDAQTARQPQGRGCRTL